MVKALHAAGLEVILDVVYNHTGEGDELRPDPGVPRPRQQGLLPAPGRRPALRRLHRLRQHPRRAATRTSSSSSWTRCATGCWRCTSTGSGSTSRAALAAVDARRRHAQRRSSPRSTRTRCCSRVKLIAEPWDVGPGGYQVGEFPPLWTRVERQVPRRRARLLARARRGGVRELGYRALRFVRPLLRRRATALRVGQLRHRPRRLHAARPGVVRAQAQRGQRRGQPRRLRRQPLVEPRRRGRDRRCRGPGGAAAVAAQPADHLAARRPAYRC